MPNDGPILPNPYINDDGPDKNIHHQYRDSASQAYPFSPFSINDPLHSFETESLPINSDGNLFDHDFLLGDLDFGPLEPLHGYNLDIYDTQMDDAIADQHTYTSQTESLPSMIPQSSTPQHRTRRAASDLVVEHNNYMANENRSTVSRPSAHHIRHQSHPHSRSGTHWASSFPDANLVPRNFHSQRQQRKQQHQQDTPAPTPTDTPSNPATPTWQTTIRFSEADPTTISTVIEVLAKSQAKFVYETH